MAQALKGVEGVDAIGCLDNDKLAWCGACGACVVLPRKVLLGIARMPYPAVRWQTGNKFPDRHGFWGRFVKSLQNTASRRFSVAFHGLGNGRRLC